MQLWVKTIVPMLWVWAVPVTLGAQERPYYDGGYFDACIHSSMGTDF
jgi:hypothetical protein